MKKYILIIAVAILALSSCGNGDNFRLSGTIDNAANTTLYLQSSINGRWIVIDTVSVNDNGGFDYQRQAPRFPEIYRLVLDDIDNAISLSTALNILPSTARRKTSALPTLSKVRSRP